MLALSAQQDFGESALFGPLQNALSTFLSYLPQLIGAILILVIGYFVARALQAVVGRLLQGIGFNGWMERGGITQFFERAQTRQTPASILGKLVFWAVFIIALTMASDALGIPQVSQVLGQLIAYIPSIIAALLILVLAALLANCVSGVVRGATGSGIMASVAQYAIIVYAVFAAITELGIAVQLTAPTFLILLGAVALAAGRSPSASVAARWPRISSKRLQPQGRGAERRHRPQVTRRLRS